MTQSDKEPEPTPHSRTFLAFLWLELLLFPFLFVIMLIVLIAFTNEYFKGVKSTPEALHPPYSPYVWTSAVAPIAISSLGLTWAVLSWWHQFTILKHSKHWWAATTVFRLCITVILVVTAVLTAQFLPLPLGSCENQRKWRPEANVDPLTPTLFELLPKGWWWSKKSHRYFYMDNCHRLVEIWKLDIAVAALYFVTACCSGYISVATYVRESRTKSVL
ncbi:uncharacterized protein APUU_60105A [Aspergillus puulaauensis]|uniref:Uncharacterized protein n=1 Tax=Aspergillus puulaauensis TaxID=1220207 RepID=A0A7R8AQG8_9EURO|nr:uncharacterized protein APUU_60105A [Aspergillus puulaauensis]BCS27057.1 hypothetical protein APUU_60105A [Aspergillus puulaauensis]